MRQRAFIPLLVVASLSGLGGCASLGRPTPGLQNQTLSACASAPHCVSSLALDPDQAVAPLVLRGRTEQAWAVVREELGKLPRTRVVAATASYLHAEVTSPWHFYTDDLELLLRPDLGRIEIRSSSRIGYYDFGVNRDRVEALRAVLARRGVVAP